MLGAVFATLKASGTVLTPRTATSTAVRRKPVAREATVPRAIVPTPRSAVMRARP